jgi:HlyD family secretion protein
MNEHVQPMSAPDVVPAEVVVLPVAHAKPAPRPLATRSLVATCSVLLLLTVAGGIYWMTGSGTAVRYTAVPVTKGTVARTVTATGTVNPVLTIIVGT